MDEFNKHFGRKVYDGNYSAVFLDEILRTDNSKLSQQFGKLLKKVRYGNFSDNDMKSLQNMTAKKTGFART